MTKFLHDELSECKQALDIAAGWQAPEVADEALQVNALMLSVDAARKQSAADVDRARFVAENRWWQVKAAAAASKPEHYAVKLAKLGEKSVLPEPPKKATKITSTSSSGAGKVPITAVVGKGEDVSLSSVPVASVSKTSAASASSGAPAPAEEVEKSAASSASKAPLVVVTSCQKVILVYTSLDTRKKVIAKLGELFAEDLDTLPDSLHELKGAIPQWWGDMLWSKQKKKDVNLHKWIRAQLGAYQECLSHVRVKWLRKAFERMRSGEDKYFPPPSVSSKTKH